MERSLAALKEHGNTLGVAPTGCHTKGTPILLYDGQIKPVEDIQVGDQLMGPDSRPRTVLNLHRGQDDLYEIQPRKGEPFTVNAGHLLSLVKTHRHHNPYRRHGAPTGSIINISVVAYLEQSEQFKQTLYTISIAENSKCC